MGYKRIGGGTHLQTMIAHDPRGHKVLGLHVPVHRGLVLGLVSTVRATVPAIGQPTYPVSYLSAQI